MTRREALHVEVGDDVLGVEVCGEGPAVVLLHGSGGNRITWHGVVPLLAATRTVVVVESRGSGASTDRARAYGPVACAEDLEAVRSKLGVEQWDVVGHSAGGWTALRYAATYPDRCRSVTAVSSLAGVFPPEADGFWQELVANLTWGPQGLGQAPSLTPSFRSEHPDRAYLYQLAAALNSPPAADAPFARVRDFDLTPDDLARLTMPVTFVAGTADSTAPADVVAHSAAALGARLVTHDGGHVPFWEDAEAFAGLLLPLLPP